VAGGAKEQELGDICVECTLGVKALANEILNLDIQLMESSMHNIALFFTLCLEKVGERRE